MDPVIKPIRSGWAAYGDGWAAHGATAEDALANFREAEERRRVTMSYRVEYLPEGGPYCAIVYDADGGVVEKRGWSDRLPHTTRTRRRR